MIAVLIGTLPSEYDPEVKIIEREPKINFEMAVEELRSREVKLQQATNDLGMRYESKSVNAIANSSMQRCVHCHRAGHLADKCYTLHPELRNQSGRGHRRGNVRGRGGRSNQSVPQSLQNWQIQFII